MKTYILLLLSLSVLTACHYNNEYGTCINTSQCPRGICKFGKCQLTSCAQSTAVYFDNNEYALGYNDESALNSFIRCLKSNSNARIRVSGHTDERGTDEANAVLSKQRAETVAQYLINSGVSASRIIKDSHGSSRPVDTDGDETSWAQNRRTIVTLE